MTSKPGLSLRRAWHTWGLVALLAAFACLATVYSIVTPLFESPDELWHYPFVAHLAAGHGLPVQDPASPEPWQQEGGQPPLYYALAALASRWASSEGLPQLMQRNPHADIGIVRPGGSPNIVLHTPRELMPYRDAALGVHLARGLSVILGALTVLLAYLIGLEILPWRPGLALAGAAVAGLTPMFLFISGSVNNDNLLITLSTASLWLLLRLLRQPPTVAGWALLGAIIGLAALSKITALGLLPLAALGLAWVAWRRRDWRVFLWGGTCVVGAAAAVAGWWYLRNWRLYHDPLGLNVFLAIVGRRRAGFTVSQLLGEWQCFVRTYWGLFGWVNVAAPGWFYRLFNALALLAGCGLGGRAVWRLWRGPRADPDTAFRLALAAFWPLIVTVGLVRWTMMTMASQGRLLFPAIAPLSYLLVLGLASWLPGRWRALLPSLGAALMAGLAVWVPFAVIAPAYARPPLLTPAGQAAIPQRLDLTFGGSMELLGYRLGAQELMPDQDLAVTLYWRARAPMDRDYSVFIHLLDQNGVTIAQRDVYAGSGLFPTTLWRPGDAIADTYVIHVPANTFNPTRLQIRAGLYLLETGERLPVRDHDGREVGDSASFGAVLVRAGAPGGIANTMEANLDNQVALLGYNLDRTAVEPGETLHLTLYWKALRPLSRDYTAFARVLDSEGGLWAGKASWARDGAAPSSGWAVGQTIEDARELAVRPDTPPGIYYVDAGMYLADTGQSLSVRDSLGHAHDSRVILTRIRVLPATPPATRVPAFTFPTIGVPLDVDFGGVAHLKGFSLEQQTLNPNEPLHVTLFWQALSEGPGPTSYSVFVHLLDAQNQIVAQHDGPPALGLWPTTDWVKGQAIVDRHDMALADGSYAGRLRLEVGLYDPQSLQRLRTGDGDDRVVLPVEISVHP